MCGCPPSLPLRGSYGGSSFASGGAGDRLLLGWVHRGRCERKMEAAGIEPASRNVPARANYMFIPRSAHQETPTGGLLLEGPRSVSRVVQIGYSARTLSWCLSPAPTPQEKVGRTGGLTPPSASVSRQILGFPVFTRFRDLDMRLWPSHPCRNQVAPITLAGARMPRPSYPVKEPYTI